VAPFAESQQPLTNRVVIDRLSEIVAGDRGREIVADLNAHEQPLRPGTLLVGDADLIEDLKV
jgi:hypothetical protein